MLIQDLVFQEDSHRLFLFPLSSMPQKQVTTCYIIHPDTFDKALIHLCLMFMLIYHIVGFNTQGHLPKLTDSRL